jgi:hypothetical protein
MSVSRCAFSSGHLPERGSGQSFLPVAETPKLKTVSATTAAHSVPLDAQKPAPQVVVQPLRGLQQGCSRVLQAALSLWQTLIW